MTKRQLAKYRKTTKRARERAAKYVKPEEFNTADEYRFGVKAKR